MVILGKNLLNKNDYTVMIVVLTQPGYLIKVIGGSRAETIPAAQEFTDSLNGLKDEDKVIKIVEYFLEYSQISELSNSVYISSLDGNYTVVGGTNGRKLVLKLNSSKLSNRVLKLVDSKYKQDRHEYFNDNDIRDIFLSDTNTKMYEDGALYVKSDKKAGNYYVENSERRFLNEMLKKKFNYIDEAYTKRVRGHSQSLGYVDLGKYIICGNTSIYMGNSKVLEDVIDQIIEEYNQEVKNIRSKEGYQLKIKL